MVIISRIIDVYPRYLTIIDHERPGERLRDLTFLSGHPAEVLYQRHSGAYDGAERADKVGDGPVQEESEGEDPRVLPRFRVCHVVQHHPHVIDPGVPGVEQGVHDRTDGESAATHARRHSRLSPHAPSHLSLLHEQGELLAADRQVPVRGTHF